MVVIVIDCNSKLFTLMKRLILIQNDYSGAGKTTLSQCLHHYLESYQVPHHRVALVEARDETTRQEQIEVEHFEMPSLIAHLDRSDLVILEIESGLTQHFNKFYEKRELEQLLPEMGFELTVLIPVTSEEESFDGVLSAAEVFSDTAQYLVVHTPTSSFYDDDEQLWDKSYAARVMDMFEAADMEMPTCHDMLEYKLKTTHAELPVAMETTAQTDEAMHAEVSKWFRRVACQLDSVRKYVFGDAFRPAIALPPPEKTRKRNTKPRAKAKMHDMAA